MTRLRKRLDGEAIVFAGHGYRLDVPPEQVDHVRFERLVDEARRRPRDGAHQAALEAVEHALGLWRGHPFASVADTSSLAGLTAHLMEVRANAIELERRILDAPVATVPRRRQPRPPGRSAGRAHAGVRTDR